jgi:hypothetical protein
MMLLPLRKKLAAEEVRFSIPGEWRRKNERCLRSAESIDVAVRFPGPLLFVETGGLSGFKFSMP